MTNDEFEILKQRVGKDYRVIMTNYPKVQVTVEKVDPFEDVKYVRERYSNIVRKVKGFDKDWLFTTSGIGVRKSHAEIVNETIYIDYLISKSKSLFGEIQNGDEFEDVNGVKTKTLLYSYSSFIYNNRYDQLFYGDVVLYQAGKWAKRTFTKPNVHSVVYDNGTLAFYSNNQQVIISNDIKDYLTQQMQIYLEENVQ